MPAAVLVVDGHDAGRGGGGQRLAHGLQRPPACPARRAPRSATPRSRAGCPSARPRRRARPRRPACPRSPPAHSSAAELSHSECPSCARSATRTPREIASSACRVGSRPPATAPSATRARAPSVPGGAPAAARSTSATASASDARILQARAPGARAPSRGKCTCASEKPGSTQPPSTSIRARARGRVARVVEERRDALAAHHHGGRLGARGVQRPHRAAVQHQDPAVVVHRPPPLRARVWRPLRRASNCGFEGA